MKYSSSAWSFGKSKRDAKSQSKGNIPGPGMYGINNSNRDSAPSWKIGKAEKLAKYNLNNTPGVGQYNLDKPQDGAPKYTLRPKAYAKENNNIYNPGPGMYSPNYNSLYKSNEKYSMRPKTALLKDNSNVPGPGQYSIRNDKSDLKQPSFIFGKEEKCKPLNSEVKLNPGPGNYSVSDIATNANAPKFSFGKEERGNENIAKSRAKTPGPGQYATHKKNDFGTGGPKISMSFVKPNILGLRSETPGPGQYSSTNKTYVKAPEYK